MVNNICNNKTTEIVHQIKNCNYSYFQTSIQKIHYKITNSITGKYSNLIYISQFIKFLNIHIFNNNITTEIEDRFNLLYIPMLYMIFIIKYYIFYDFKEKDIFNKKKVETIKGLLTTFIPEYNDNFENYYLDIIRYLFKNNLPYIIGFGYDNQDNKISIIINDYPLSKISEKNVISLNPNSIKKKEVLSRKLLRKYLEGEKTVYKLTFLNYSDYDSFESSIFNVDVISSFLAECNLDTVGWVEVIKYRENTFESITTIQNEYFSSYKSIKPLNINYYPEPSILSFDIECMSNDLESFPNRYTYEDFISTLSIVYKYKEKIKRIAICVNYKNDKTIINDNDLKDINTINTELIPFIDANMFKNACTEQKNNNNVENKIESNNNVENKIESNKNLNKKENNNNVENKIENNKKNICINGINNNNVNINHCNNNYYDIRNYFEKKCELNNRYDRLKNILMKNNSCSEHVNNRYSRLKSILDNSSSSNNNKNNNNNNNNVKRPIEENEENNYKNFEDIEIFIKKLEGNKNNKKDKNLINNMKKNEFDYKITFVSTEYELLCKFFEKIKELDPDIIIGYNTFGFDYKYLAQRMGMYLIIDRENTPFCASRIKTKRSKFINLVNDEVELFIPGRIAVDMYKYAKSLNLPSSSLNYVAEHLLNEKKIDLPYKEMFHLIYQNKEDTLKEVAKYCIMDSILTLNIFNVSHQWIQLLEIAKISRIRIDEIYKTGQSKKFSNLLYKHAYDNNICIDLDTSNITGYKGATVIEPIPNVYNYCTMLDFTSLYPSVIITHNICYTTLIKNKDIKKYPKDSYHKIDIGDKVYYYTKSHMGILPKMMKKLLSERVRYKKLMKSSSGSDYVIYDKRQYALKIQANSIYGCLGSSSLKYLRFLPGAECTTGMGRNYLNKTIEIIQTSTNFNVIYGDTDSCLIEYKKENYEKDDNNNTPDEKDDNNNTPDEKDDNNNNNNNSNRNNNNNMNNNNNNRNINSIKDFDLNKFIEESKGVADYVTNLLPEGMHLKYENTFSRMLIISKKKYSGILANTSELYIKGIDLIKKNTCTFVRDYYKIFLYMMLYNYPEELIKKKVLEMKTEILTGKVPLNKLIMRLSIGPKYVNNSYYVLLFVNNHKKLNLDYKVGEKINYIIVNTKTFSFNENSELLGDKIMSIDLYNNIYEKSLQDKSIILPKPDYEYYYDHYLKSGIKKLLKPYNEKFKDIL
ncbi:DNA/RNA polymerase [Anaeromyces robustus]|uniref:DNA polymerase delta catalytic subunit n=1 Tax=Anaeromyces robustus TaxID=1754192 RepID=A0A1Y1WIZ4_9FUNG|nr:DNA/RNA polymerase [Anaeromyces robustus]|eukprot:ORX73452.1 DNA/RNA polymerase [Anaeromyces robustus]